MGRMELMATIRWGSLEPLCHLRVSWEFISTIDDREVPIWIILEHTPYCGDRTWRRGNGEHEGERRERSLKLVRSTRVGADFTCLESPRPEMTTIARLQKQKVFNNEESDTPFTSFHISATQPTEADFYLYHLARFMASR